MTNKVAAMQTSTSGKAKLTAAKSLPAVTASSRMQRERRLKSTKQVHPLRETASTKWQDFPNEEFRASVDNNTDHVIDTSAEPYLVPITTKTQGSSVVRVRGDQVSKTKKVALLPKGACESLQSVPKDWESFVKTGRPIPPPKIVSSRSLRRNNICEEHIIKKQTSEEQRIKSTSSTRRDLAYLVVELDHSKISANRGRKKSFDDLDAELQLRSAREERNSLTRSNSVSVSNQHQQRHRSPQGTQSPPPRPPAASTMSGTKLKLNSPIFQRGRLGKTSPDSSLSRIKPMRGNKQSSNTSDSGEATDSATPSDLSSDAFHSVDSSSDSRTSPTPRKKQKSPPQRRRAPPPPPTVTTTPPTTVPPPPPFSLPPALTGSHTLQASRPGVMSNSLGQRTVSLSRQRSPAPGAKKTMGKSTSETQLRGAKLPSKPPGRPPPPRNKPQLKETKSLATTASSQKPHMKVRPLISNPHLISTTKTLPSTPVTGKYRSLPSPPPISESAPTKSYMQGEFENDGHTEAGYEEVNFDPVPPPRRKRTKSKSSPNMNVPKKNSPALQSKGLLSQRRQSDNSIVQARLAQMRLMASPEPRRVPEEYLEPSPSVNCELRESEEDEPVDDYEDMRPVVPTEIVTAPNPDDPDGCYVDMQPVQNPLQKDSPDPVYEYMDPGVFLKAPKKNKKEPLHYATCDLIRDRSDLTAPSSKKDPKKKKAKR